MSLPFARRLRPPTCHARIGARTAGARAPRSPLAVERRGAWGAAARRGSLLLAAVLGLAAGPGRLSAQNIISVPFTNGFVGTRGSSAGTSNGILTYATLGIARTFFIQSSSSNQFELQGNDIPGTLRIVRTNGTTIDMPASANWRNSGGTTYLIGILPRPTSPVTLSYSGGSIQITDGTNSGGSSLGGYVAGYAGPYAADGVDMSGNAAQSQVLGGMNSYLATVTSQRPAGPVTVSALSTSSTTPTVTGTATLQAGENLSVVVNNQQYTTSTTPAVAVSGTSWSLALASPLAPATYSVTATITNANGFTLSDATSNELTVTSGGGGTVTVAGSFTANDKVYDGAAAATGTTTGLTLVGVGAGDQVTIASATLAFGTPAASAGRTVSITGITLGGTDAARYAVSLAGAPTATAAITPKALTVAGVSASSKTYDGGTAAALTGTPTYTGLVAGESFAVAGTPSATFATAAVGNAKPVTVVGYAAPNANYTAAQPSGLAANVTAKPLTIGGSFAAASKSYDGTTSATITTNALSLVGVVGGDAVSLTGVSAAFASASVGTAKTVSLSGATLSGAESGNYTLSLAGAPTATADVTSAGGAVTIGGTFTANDRVYDGGTVATGTTAGLTLAGVTAPDQVTIASVTLAFQTAAAGAGKAVTITGVTLGGADAARYTASLAGAPSATASITPRSLTIGGVSAADKTYDGTTAAALAGTPSYVGLAPGESFAVGGTPTASFASPGVGTAKPVTVTGYVVPNTNYALAQPSGLTADVGARPVTIGGSFTASSKRYDGTAAATIATSALTPSGVVAGETLSLTGLAATFADASVGTVKPVSLTAATLAGATAANYALSLAGAPTTTADITAAGGTVTIAGSFAANDRTYDGTTAAAGSTSGLTLAGVNAPDQVTIASVTLAFGSAAAGAGKAVTITGVTLGGTDAARYAVSLAGAPTATATIAPKALTVAGVSAVSRAYDGTTAATLTGAPSYAGLVSGESFPVGGAPAASFATPDVGAGKPVTVTGYAAPNANYTLAQPAGLTASVTPKSLTLGGAFTAADKTYDGTAAATIAAGGLTLVGVVGSDAVSLAGVSAAFADATVGADKPVTLRAATLAGPAASNYTLSLAGAPATTASVTALGGTVTLGGGFTASDKTYDGTTAAAGATGGLTLVGVPAQAQVTIAAVTLAFQSAAAGAGKTVVVTGVTLGGPDAARFSVSLAGAPTTTASVLRRTLTVGGSFVAADKVFDGTAAATIGASALVPLGVVSGDAVAIASPSASFASAAVGAAKPVSLTGATLAGAAAANYTLSLAGAPTTTASIVAAAPPSAPAAVTAAAGDGSAAVSWTAPDATGCGALTGYAAEYSGDGGTSWTRVTLAATATSAVLSGLQNNVVYRVRVAAVNGCGVGPFALAAPVVPVAPTRDGTGQPETVAPGAVSSTTGGVEQAATTEVVQDTAVRVTTGPVALQLHASDGPGATIPLDSGRTMRLERGGRATADGSGLAPGTMVTGYLLARSATPMLLGMTAVAADGSFEMALPVPDALAEGSYTLQVNGVDRARLSRSVSLGVAVASPPPDLALAAVPDQTSPAAGDTITITITVTNQGRGAATDVVLPRAFHEPGFAVVRATPLDGRYDAASLTWTIPRIEPGTRARMLLTVVVAPPAPPGTTP